MIRRRPGAVRSPRALASPAPDGAGRARTDTPADTPADTPGDAPSDGLRDPSGEPELAPDPPGPTPPAGPPRAGDPVPDAAAGLDGTEMLARRGWVARWKLDRAAVAASLAEDAAAYAALLAAVTVTAERAAEPVGPAGP